MCVYIIYIYIYLYVHFIYTYTYHSRGANLDKQTSPNIIPRMEEGCVLLFIAIKNTCTNSLKTTLSLSRGA